MTRKAPKLKVGSKGFGPFVLTAKGKAECQRTQNKALADELEACIDLLDILVVQFDNNWPRYASPWPGRITAVTRIAKAKQVLAANRKRGM